MSKVLGLDFGEKRVGLALSSEDKKYAFAYDTLKNDSHLIERILDICILEKIEKIVIGLPLGLSGKETSQTKMVKEFAKKLKSKITIPIKFQDERFTSKMSLSLFKEAKIKKKKQKIDESSARIILQDFLDKKNL